MRRRGLILALALAAPVPAPAEPLAVLFPGDPASHDISVTVTPGLSSMSALPSLTLRNVRRRMHAGEEIPDPALRELAAWNDGLAAAKYLQRLRTRPAAHPSELAWYAAIAAGTGRTWALRDMIAAMGRLDPATEPKERMRKYIRVLYAHAWAGNEMALDAVIAFNGPDRLFGPLSEATRAKILAEAERIGNGRIELRMAMRLLEDRPLPEAARAEVTAYLARAAGSDHPGIAAAAQALKRQLAAAGAEG